ncbi:hypothetical protein HUJ05_002311 [Dendroctonus ponderosae]|nr:hypothetical protein HUJ05_002311 [Dendroctonus ponderosae]
MSVIDSRQTIGFYMALDNWADDIYIPSGQLSVDIFCKQDSRQDCQCATKSYEKLEETLKDYLEELHASILGTHWDVLVQKYLISCGLLIFFSKLREILLFLLTVFSALACYAPNNKVFMLLLIPLVVLRSTIQSTWRESLGGVAAGPTAPLVFGILANETALTHLVVVLSTCIPLMMCWVTIRMCSKTQNELGSEQTPGHQHIDWHEDQGHYHEDYEHDDG